MKKIIILFLGNFICVVTSGQSNWKVSTYSINFSIDHALGATADGKFSDLSCNIWFNTSALDKSTIYATVAAHTITTGNDSSDRNIKDVKYLNTSRYPIISLKSKQILADQNDYIGYFDVMIKGVVKKIKIPFSFVRQGSKATVLGKFKINRLDFGVGSSSIMLGDLIEVNVLLNLLGT